MLCTSDIHFLIQYCTIVESFFVMFFVSGLLYLRWKKPKTCPADSSEYFRSNFLCIDLYLPNRPTYIRFSFNFIGWCFNYTFRNPSLLFRCCLERKTKMVHSFHGTSDFLLSESVLFTSRR